MRITQVREQWHGHIGIHARVAVCREQLWLCQLGIACVRYCCQFFVASDRGIECSGTVSRYLLPRTRTAIGAGVRRRSAEDWGAVSRSTARHCVVQVVHLGDAVVELLELFR